MKKINKLLSKVTSLLRWLLYFLIKLILYPYVFLVQNVRFRKNGYKIPKTPCFFLSNHQSNWDGIYIEMMFPTRVIHYLVNEVIFRNAILNFLVGKVLGMVKRGEGKNDMTSVKNIIDLKKKGKNIGLFPEGDIDMWGRTMQIDDSIAKLCKKLNMPIVLLRIDGAYMRACRWGRLPRRSRVTYSIQNVLSTDYVKTLSVGELHQKILDGISYDESKYQESAKIKVLFPWGRAEHLEYGLFWCPKCHALHSLYTSNNTLYCANCSMTAYLNADYTLSSSDNLPKTPTAWADEQKAYIPEYLSKIENGSPVLKSREIRLSITPRRHFFGHRFTVGNLTLFCDRLEHVDKNGEKTTIKLIDAEKICLQQRDILEIQTELVKVRFSRPEILWSGYSWVTFCNYLKDNIES